MRPLRLFGIDKCDECKHYISSSAVKPVIRVGIAYNDFMGIFINEHRLEVTKRYLCSDCHSKIGNVDLQVTSDGYCVRHGYGGYKDLYKARSNDVIELNIDTETVENLLVPENKYETDGYCDRPKIILTSYGEDRSENGKLMRHMKLHAELVADMREDQKIKDEIKLEKLKVKKTKLKQKAKKNGKSKKN